jgi:hypothetical protein
MTRNCLSDSLEYTLQLKKNCIKDFTLVRLGSEPCNNKRMEENCVAFSP